MFEHPYMNLRTHTQQCMQHTHTGFRVAYLCMNPAAYVHIQKFKEASMINNSHMCTYTHEHVHAFVPTQEIIHIGHSAVVLQECWQGNPSPLWGAVYSGKAGWTRRKWGSRIILTHTHTQVQMGTHNVRKHQHTRTATHTHTHTHTHPDMDELLVLWAKITSVDYFQL